MDDAEEGTFHARLVVEDVIAAGKMSCPFAARVV
jgi:hypothetical protein